MPHQVRRGDVAALFGLLWAVSCMFLVGLRFTTRENDVVSASLNVSKSRVFDLKWTSDSISNASTMSKNATLSLVETLPIGDFNLSSAVPQTFETLIQHVKTSKFSIDISAMYWNLLGEEDRRVYSDADMSKFGADRGRNLLLALTDAAIRGVKIRVLTAKQTNNMFDKSNTSCSSLPSELRMLVDAAQQNVQVRCWGGSDWYGSGILHQKLWIFDRSHVYVGSANMDWKSLAQVMEVGVIMENLSPNSVVIQDIQKLFKTWWMFASDDFLPAKTDTYFSEKFQHQLQVPKWSLYLPNERRSDDPFVKAGLSALGNISHQLQILFSTPSDSGNSTEIVSRPSDMFVAASPLEVTVGDSRTFDEDALVYSIRSAKSSISLSVMDFVPFSMYTPGPLYWPALTDALLAGVYSKPGLQVRLLVSQWQHTSPQMLQALATLEKQAKLCHQTHAQCSGRLEIKLFRVPGWQNTTSSSGPKSTWPSYTRVNHAKYIVTDTRANVGTSNMEWGYFYTTAGMSINTNHEPTRQALEKVFERNWNSPYANALKDVMLNNY
ncbi:putative phospholipase D/Transphosphatidylase, PLD-like domain-containing protein [Plasmopara halstedii]